MFTLDTVAGNRTGAMRRLATTLDADKTELMLLCSRPKCCDSDPISIRFHRDTTRQGPRRGTSAQHSMDSQVTVLVKKTHTIPLHSSPALSPERLRTLVKLFGYLARPMPSFRLCNESDKCMQRSKKILSFAFRTACV